ncbi:hypothetical protein RclHR1_00200028 [Rhizophagus clarus]|uniref:Uncharacterized protein n=1 Tax=Rhizophagus clarus TaxID=94130 RepID=A0A2Z6QSN6_9GLOM|nr:hypothetical protein RclHR1_00200028 [Rhizophagus clarus]GES99482.1 hypothetical protein GLOIN_2v1541010 [Rhizophagus clarus]
MTTFKSSTSTSSTPISKNSHEPTLFIVVHNIHHMRLEFPPPPNNIIPTSIWDRVVAKLRMLGLKFIYKTTGNIDDSKLHEFEREENHPVVVHHEYNIHTGEFKHAKDGAQVKYAQEMDPILGKVVTFPGDMNFVQEEIISSIQHKAREIASQYRQNDIVVKNPETFSPESVLNIIVAVFLLWWIFISITMIRSYLTYYRQRMNFLTQTNNSSQNMNMRYRYHDQFSREKITSENHDENVDELSDEIPIVNGGY